MTARRERMTVLAVLSAMALVVLDAGLVNVALPTIARAFGETPTRTVLVVGAYQLGLLVGLLPSAHLAERLGQRRLFVIGVTLFGACALLCAGAPSFPALVAARWLQGLGGAAIMALGIALLRRALGADRLPQAIAWNALVVALCSGLGPALGAAALALAGWPWLFAIALPMAVVALLAAPALPASPPADHRIDPLGVALYAAAAAALFAAAQLARPAPFAAALAAVVALLAFRWLLARDRGRKRPLVPLDLLALPRFRKSAIASILFFIAQSAGLLALPFHIQLSLARSAAFCGLILALWPLAVAATSRMANRLADRFGCEPLCSTGALLLGAGLAAMATSPGGATPLAACTLLCGIGFGLFQLPNNRILFLSAPEARSAAAGGLQGTARLAGQTAGSLLVGLILSAAPVAIAPRLAIGLAGLAALLAAVASWRRSSSDPDLQLGPCATAVAS